MARRQIWVGLDVGADKMSACAVDDAGAVILEQTVPTNARDLHRLIKSFKRRIRMIGMESGPYSIHLVRSLRQLRYPVAMFDCRQASKFLAIRQNKTDKNDARGLADIARLRGEAVSEVRVKSVECQRLRSTLATRQKLLQLRLATESTIRSLFRLNGGKVERSWSAQALRRNVRSELARLRKVEKIDLTDEVMPLLTLAEAMRAYLENLSARLELIAKDSPVCRRFMEIPGVGPICALSFYSAIEDPSRFSRSSDVGAYLGLVPKVRQSGESTVRMRISKMGNSMTRAHLATAALQHLRYAKSDIQQWGEGLAERIGKARARTAVARKLAVVMIAMWKADEPYRASIPVQPPVRPEIGVSPEELIPA
jgi:transposase